MNSNEHEARQYNAPAVESAAGSSHLISSLLDSQLGATPASRIRRGSTQSKIDNRKSKILARSAFTLIEILTVIAIAGMMTVVLAVGYSRLADTRPSTPDEVFWNTVTAARRQALLSAREVRLAFTAASEGDNSSPALHITWTAPDGTPGEQRFPFENMGDITLEFLSTQKGIQTVMIGGEVVETQTIPHMTFHGDGTCTPVRIQIRRGAGSSHILDIDPWTCAQMLVREENK